MKKFLLMAIGALMVVMNVSAQVNAQALPTDEGIRLRGCRVGDCNPQFAPRRALSLQNDVTPYIGDRRQLVVLASFQDQDFKADRYATLAIWDEIFNAANFTEGKYAGSVHDYFAAQSYGQFNLLFDLVFVELPDERHKYRSTNADDENSQYMVDDIVDVLQTQDIDWSLYDWDGDAFVDQLIIIYAGEGMNASLDRNTIWPHQWWLSQHKNLETDDMYDFRSYRIVDFGDKEYYIDCYCCIQESVDYYDVKTPFGTICHEYSHCFGLPDFYYGDGEKVLAEWDLMDYGNYNEHGFRPCNYSAHERMLMGWLTPVELTDSTSIADMPALCDEPRAYLVRNDGAENEYYIIENRQKRGWDEQLPGSGILVFHVDYDKDAWTGANKVPNSYYEKRYSIFPANNNARVGMNGGWAYPYVAAGTQGNGKNTNDELTNTSQPAATLNNANVDGEKLMSKPITKMFVDADGLASFVFKVGETTSIHHPWMEGDVETNEPSVIHGDAWYLPDGRRLSGMPTARGLYLYKGKKVFVPFSRNNRM